MRQYRNTKTSDTLKQDCVLYHILCMYDFRCQNCEQVWILLQGINSYSGVHCNLVQPPPAGIFSHTSQETLDILIPRLSSLIQMPPWILDHGLVKEDVGTLPCRGTWSISCSLQLWTSAPSPSTAIHITTPGAPTSSTSSWT